MKNLSNTISSLAELRHPEYNTLNASMIRQNESLDDNQRETAIAEFDSVIDYIEKSDEYYTTTADWKVYGNVDYYEDCPEVDVHGAVIQGKVRRALIKTSEVLALKAEIKVLEGMCITYPMSTKAADRLFEQQFRLEKLKLNSRKSLRFISLAEQPATTSTRKKAAF